MKDQVAEHQGPIRINPIEVRSPQGDSLTVNPLGARIDLNLGTTPILTSVTRGDGKLGETHPCTPIFGPDKNNLYGLSQHGNMRNETCDVKSIGGDTVVISHNITDSPGRYPQGVKIEQQLHVENGTFTFKMTHANDGEIEAPVNGGEHCYFAAPQGYRGTLINGRDITSLIEADTTIPLEASNIIKIPGLPGLTLTQEGFHFAMLWVGKNAQGQTDGNYVCIEPVEGDPLGSYFGSPESMIVPHSERTAQFSISTNSSSA